MGTQFVCEKCFTFDSDLDLGHGNLNFVCDTLSHFTLPFLLSLIKFPLWFFSYD